MLSAPLEIGQFSNDSTASIKCSPNIGRPIFRRLFLSYKFIHSTLNKSQPLKHIAIFYKISIYSIIESFDCQHIFCNSEGRFSFVGKSKDYSKSLKKLLYCRSECYRRILMRWENKIPHCVRNDSFKNVILGAINSYIKKTILQQVCANILKSPSG